MNRFLPFLLAFVAFVGLAFLPANDLNVDPRPELAIGASAPLADQAMKNVDGAMMSLASSKGEKGLLVVFSCNTCPFVVGNGEKSEGWEGRYNDLAKFAARNDIGMVLVNSNEAKRGGDDSFEAMVAHAQKNRYTMPYLLDEKHKLADAFGATKTPHVFLFDGALKLVYRGAIDDNVSRAKEVKEHYLRNALTQLGKGAPIAQPETAAMGCSIKRQ